MLLTAETNGRVWEEWGTLGDIPGWRRGKNLSGKPIYFHTDRSKHSGTTQRLAEAGLTCKVGGITGERR